MERALPRLLELTDDPAALAAIAPHLAERIDMDSGAIEGAERGWLARDGIAALGTALAPASAARMAAAVEALVAADLPAVMLYAFEPPWALGRELARKVSALLAREYRVVEDVWAWRVEPGAAGWPPHRGVSDARLDRDAPEVINVWVALAPAPADRACMHAIPLDDDPGYPNALARTDAGLAAVRALPLDAGAALAGNANVLHWGGPCAARAGGARVSCSFTLSRTLPAAGDLDFAGRIRAVARQIVTYGQVSETMREWASVTLALQGRKER